LKNTISGVLNKALDDEVISANPALSLGKNFLKAENLQKGISPLSRDELKLLLDAVQAHFPEHYSLLLVLARTGMRIGEALALRWGDIDFASRFIDVKRSLVRGRISTPKNGKGRPVDMSLQLTEAFKAHQLQCKKKGLALGLGDLPECVFTNEKGRAIDKGNWRARVFNKALKKAGLRTKNGSARIS
jgi:integrase